MKALETAEKDIFQKCLYSCKFYFNNTLNMVKDEQSSLKNGDVTIKQRRN